MQTENFASLALIKPIQRALQEEGYLQPTPIQRNAIPEVLAEKDLLATAQTGTGKTAAFSLPILQLLHAQVKPKSSKASIRALILSPTRELALQIEASLRTYGRHLPLRTAVVVGGVPLGSQLKALQRKPDILVATPGRLLDLHQNKKLRLDQVAMFVLDEADRMLDMGFLPDVRRIMSLVPQERQTLLFSATISPEIGKLAGTILKNPAKVAVTPSSSVSHKIEQQVFFVDQENKRSLLVHLLKESNVQRALVFTRTKHRANRIARTLSKKGLKSDAIHSNKSQNARQRALAAFDRGRIKVLVATDIVARGIDVDGISHVINFELPNEPESYVHRIGRTARAGACGQAFSLCAKEELPLLRDIEKQTKTALVQVKTHPFHSNEIARLKDKARTHKKPKRTRRRQRGRVATGKQKMMHA